MTGPDELSGTTGGHPAVGNLADEAAQLLDALAARLAQVRVTVGEPATGDSIPEPATDHVQCVGWCPVCRSADLLRGERPEVAGKLVDSAIVVVSALRSLLPAAPAASNARSDAPDTGPSPAADRPDGPLPPKPGIERIDIR